MLNVRRFRILLCLPCLAVVSLTACSTLKTEHYPESDAARHHACETQEQITIGVDALTRSEDYRKYFGTDLRQHDIIAVHVAIENAGQGNDWVVNPEHFELIGGGPTSSFEARELENAGAVTAGAGMLLISMPLSFAGAKMFSDAKVISEQVQIKQLRTRTIGPGDKASGFLYFKLPKQSNVSAQAVRARVTSLDGGKQLTFTIRP